MSETAFRRGATRRFEKEQVQRRRAGSPSSERARSLHSMPFSLFSETLFTFDSLLYLGWMSFFIATTWREPRRCWRE